MVVASVTDLEFIAGLRRRFERHRPGAQGVRVDVVQASLASLAPLKVYVSAPDAFRAAEIVLRLCDTLAELARKPRGRPFRAKFDDRAMQDALKRHGSLRAAARAMGVAHSTLVRR